jgi:hypothetical protein
LGHSVEPAKKLQQAGRRCEPTIDKEINVGQIRGEPSDRDPNGDQLLPHSEDESSRAMDVTDILGEFELIDDQGEAFAGESRDVAKAPSSNSVRGTSADSAGSAAQTDSDQALSTLSNTNAPAMSEETARQLLGLLEVLLAMLESAADAPPQNELEGLILKAIPAAKIENGQPTDDTAPDATEPPPIRPKGSAERGIERFAGGALRREPASGAIGGANEPPRTLPRVIVVVELANTQAIVEEDRREISQEMATMVEQIAQAKVDHGFWRYENQRRAADYRLR